MSWIFSSGAKKPGMSSNKCRHRFEPRYTSGLTDSEVLAQMAATLLSSDCTAVVWKQFNRTVAEYRRRQNTTASSTTRRPIVTSTEKQAGVSTAGLAAYQAPSRQGIRTRFDRIAGLNTPQSCSAVGFRAPAPLLTACLALVWCGACSSLYWTVFGKQVP